MFSPYLKLYFIQIFRPTLVVPKLFMQIFRTAISILYDLSANFWNPISGPKDLTANIPDHYPKYLKANLWDHYQQSERFEWKYLGMLSSVPKIWKQIFSGPKIFWDNDHMHKYVCLYPCKGWWNLAHNWNYRRNNAENFCTLFFGGGGWVGEVGWSVPNPILKLSLYFP